MHVDLQGLWQFVFLFTLLWLAWMNGAMYHDFHGNNDLRARVFTFLQMGPVTAMAVLAKGAFGEAGPAFAFSFTLYQALLTWMWWRTGVHDPEHRPLAWPYVGLFLFSTLLFGASVVVTPETRLQLWSVGLLVSVLAPLSAIFLRSPKPEIQAQIDRTLDIRPSAVERFDLLIIIVLGEVIVAVVQGAAQHPDFWGGLTSALGLGLSVAVWWLYFDFVARRRPQPQRANVVGWLYLHLFVSMGIVATGAGTLNVLEHAHEDLPSALRWLLSGSLVVTLLSISALMQGLSVPSEHRSLYQRGGFVTAVTALVVMLLGLAPLEALPL